MDVMLQRHCAKFIYVVPEGLRELLTDISREVLRSQPVDIYTFIADYLDALMITRENARVAAKFVQYITECAETVANLLERTGIEREEADRIVSMIQDAFRAYAERKGILKEDEENFVQKLVEETEIPLEIIDEATVVIQNAFRNFKLRKEKEKALLSGIIDWRIAARSAIKLYRKTGVSTDEAKRAANLIKAAYKGYYTRRALAKLKEINTSFEEEVDEVTDEEGGSETFSVLSEDIRKAKAVRIDYTTVVPHVDFGDHVIFSGESAEPSEIIQETSEEFIKGLLKYSILQPVLDKAEDEDVVFIRDLPLAPIPEEPEAMEQEQTIEDMEVIAKIEEQIEPVEEEGGEKQEPEGLEGEKQEPEGVEGEKQEPEGVEGEKQDQDGEAIQEPPLDMPSEEPVGLEAGDNFEEVKEPEAIEETVQPLYDEETDQSTLPTSRTETDTEFTESTRATTDETDATADN